MCDDEAERILKLYSMVRVVAFMTLWFIFILYLCTEHRLYIKDATTEDYSLVS